MCVRMCSSGAQYDLTVSSSSVWVLVSRWCPVTLWSESNGRTKTKRGCWREKWSTFSSEHSKHQATCTFQQWEQCGYGVSFMDSYNKVKVERRGCCVCWTVLKLLWSWASAYLQTVILFLQGCIQSSGIDAEISRSAQLHVLHQVYLEKHADRFYSVQRPAEFKKKCIYFFNIYTNLWFLWECDEILLILLNAEDQVGDSFSLTQKFCLPRGKT